MQMHNKSAVESTYMPWMIWGIAAIFYGYQFILRVSPSFMDDQLMAAFNVDGMALGALTACYYYAYAGLQIPIGATLDKVRPRRTITLALLVCLVGCALFAYSPCLAVAAIGRALIGAGSAAALLGCLKLATIWFDPSKMPIMVGLTFLIGSSGALFAGRPLTALMDNFGWRYAILYLGLFALFLSVIAFLFIKDHNPMHKDDHGAYPSEKLNFSDFMDVLKNRNGWAIALYGGLMYMPLSGFADMWGVPYIKAAYGVDKLTAGYAIGAFYMGIGAGAPLFSWISHKIDNIKSTIMLSSFLSLGFFILAVYTPFLNYWVMCTALFLCGTSLGGQFLGYTVASRVNPLKTSGIACGFHNMVCMLSGVIAQPLMGLILDLTWEGTEVAGVHIFSVYGYQMAMTVVPLSIVLAVFTIRFVPEIQMSRKVAV